LLMLYFMLSFLVHRGARRQPPGQGPKASHCCWPGGILAGIISVQGAALTLTEPRASRYHTLTNKTPPGTTPPDPCLCPLSLADQNKPELLQDI